MEEEQELGNSLTEDWREGRGENGSWLDPMRGGGAGDY